MSKALLMIMVKNPELGKCKTRLAKTIGNEKALLVYKQLLSYTAVITKAIDEDVEVLYSSFIDNKDVFDNTQFLKGLQSTGELGFKMQSAFENAFSENYNRVLIIGSDCRELTTEIINQAFDALKYHDAVIGPATDGGYYLLGLSKPFFTVFNNKNWSTNTVYNDTIQDFKKNKLTYFKLPQLSDVDTEDDLIEELKELI